MSSFAGWIASIDSTSRSHSSSGWQASCEAASRERLEPLVDRHAALLHEPVGVEHDRRPGRQLHRRLDVVRAVEHAERRVVGALQVVGVAVRAEHERRHVAGVGEPNGAVVGLHDEVEQRGHLAAVEAAHQLGEPVEHAAPANGPRPRRRASRGAAGPSARRRRCRGPPRRPSPPPPGRPRAGSRRTSRRPRPRHRACSTAATWMPLTSGSRSGRRLRWSISTFDELALVGARVLDREPGAVGHQHQQALVLEREPARPGRADLHHARHLALHEQRRRHQRRTPAASIAASSARRGRKLRERHRPRPLDHLLERARDLHERARLASRVRPRRPP